MRKDHVPVKLSNSTYMFSRSASELRTYVDLSPLDLPTDQMTYNVDFYKIEYKTVYKGNEITASGIVMVPDTKDGLSTLSYQHGTIASNAEAPSQLQVSDFQLILYQAVASTGMITAVPDYIGFGASRDLMHPYYIEEPTAQAVVDNIYGARNLADELELNVNGRLYLAGYSQGGYATMATHKFIEEEGIEGFELKASFSGAGGYDVKGFQEYFFEQEVYPQPFFLAYVAQAYKVTLDFDEDLSLFFNDPYASAIPSYFDGTFTGEQINSKLNDTIRVLVNPEYLNHSETDERFAVVNNAFVENGLLDWKPTIPVYMYHGDADMTVPYQNSVDTYDQLVQNGADGSVLVFTTIPNGSHSTAFLPFLESFATGLSEMEHQ